MEKSFLEALEQAEMVLIGIGEEFDGVKELRKVQGYSEKYELLMDSEDSWLLPFWNQINRKGDSDKILGACEKLIECMKDKNYFVVSVATNDLIREMPWKNDHFVMPCGGSIQKQCANGCKDVLFDVTEKEQSKLKADLTTYKKENGISENVLGKCPECGSPLILNNIYASNYNEKGYLEQWKKYTKWLQGSLNRKILILELGVGMHFPSVIRWPFEKVAFFNNKADFWRVNEKLYQLSEELNGKGTSISQNAIDWLLSL
ncbi:MAG: hypothetical protein PHR06_13620 [Candidatus Cloacimonetes bacterium]|nr:hypothetical protein [Candidatus Cloacimonadota bacterium]